MALSTTATKLILNQKKMYHFVWTQNALYYIHLSKNTKINETIPNIFEKKKTRNGRPLFHKGAFLQIIDFPIRFP